MRISALSNEVAESALSFAWDQWAQMGVLASPRRRDHWAMDPEALLLFSLEVARRDPRLFDEILDWLAVNERLVSVQRLRNLAIEEGERALVDAALAWAGAPTRRERRSDRRSRERNLVQLFPTMSASWTGLDEVFEAHGFAKPATEPTRKSRSPDVYAPVNFAFRLRHLLGVSARAEVMRCLLTIQVPRVSAQVVARSAAYSKRNVQEALNALGAAGVLIAAAVGGESNYTVEHSKWAPLFSFAEGQWPSHADWPQLLRALTRIMRWLGRPEVEDLSDYMLASSARDLLELVGEDLLFAGVRVDFAPPGGGAWEALVATVRRILAVLERRPH